MRCVIVAAGMSTRLRPLTDEIPKCLLSVGGKTILARTIEYLLAFGISDIAIVTGFEAEKVRLHLHETFPGRRFRFILNPRFATTNNAYSLLLSREFSLHRVTPDGLKESLLILDSDIIFHPGLLDALHAVDHENKIAVQMRHHYDPEEIKVSFDEDLVLTRIGKDIPPEETRGESIGIELFSYDSALLLFKTLERRVRFGNGRREFYEAAFQELIESGTKIMAVDASRYPAIEIDSPADLERAEAQIVPQIDKMPDVRVS